MKKGKNVMKKLLIMLLTLGLAMSATACGSSKDISSQQPAPSGTAESDQKAENNTADKTPVSEPANEPSTGDISLLNDVITEAYTGAFDDDTTVYLAGNEDNSLMVVALLSPDKTESIIYAGSATAEENYIKLTDDATGNELAFDVYEEGSSMILDMGSVGTVVISEITTADMIAALEAIIAETDVLR